MPARWSLSQTLLETLLTKVERGNFAADCPITIKPLIGETFPSPDRRVWSAGTRHRTSKGLPIHEVFMKPWTKLPGRSPGSSNPLL